jgi:hypothetical protein
MWNMIVMIAAGVLALNLGLIVWSIYLAYVHERRLEDDRKNLDRLTYRLRNGKKGLDL